ncbi:hypothetical protein BD413DRAFT_535319 [Trametes elegans]|nr:hypothetical protein BD413DRAFT_535319 [Trametes elegans]
MMGTSSRVGLRGKSGGWSQREKLQAGQRRLRNGGPGFAPSAARDWNWNVLECPECATYGHVLPGRVMEVGKLRASVVFAVRSSLGRVVDSRSGIRAREACAVWRCDERLQLPTSTRPGQPLVISHHVHNRLQPSRPIATFHSPTRMPVPVDPGPGRYKAHASPAQSGFL